MNSPKVLLTMLEERTAASGTRYLTGWMGKARLVAFLDRDAPDGKTVWQLYAQQPEDRGERGEGGGADRSGSSHSNGGDRRGGYQQRPAQRHQPIPDAARRAAGDQPF